MALIEQVYQRDAGFMTGSAARRSGRRLHWAAGDDATLACDRRWLLDLEAPWDPRDVPETLRCDRPACRKRWRTLGG